MDYLCVHISIYRYTYEYFYIYLYVYICIYVYMCIYVNKRLCVYCMYYLNRYFVLNINKINTSFKSYKKYFSPLNLLFHEK